MNTFKILKEIFRIREFSGFFEVSEENLPENKTPANKDFLAKEN